MNKKILGLIFLGVLMGGMDIAVLGPAIHPIQKFFHVTSREIIWIINAYIFTSLIGTPLLSKLSDLYGRRLIYITSVALFGLGSLVVIFSSDFNLVVIGRGIQGFGSGGFLPVAAAVIGDTFPKEKQGSALGILGGVYGLAFILGPLIGGLLLMLNWRWVFVLNLPLSVILIVASLRLLPSKRKMGKIDFDWIGMSMLICCLVLYASSVNRINTTDFFHSLLSLKILPYLLVSFLIIPFFIQQQKRSHDPVINTKLFQSRQLAVAYILGFGAGLSETGVIFIPGFIKETFDISYSNASFALTPMLVALLIGALLAGRMVDKIGVKYVLLSGTVLLTAGLVSIWQANKHLASFYIAEAILGLGLASVLGAPLGYIVNNETTEENRASGQGMMLVFTNVGLIASSSVVGALIASLGGGAEGYKSAFNSLAFVSALMIVASLALKSKNTR